jgi:tyrosyl-tRNA synthetase
MLVDAAGPPDGSRTLSLLNDFGAHIPVARMVAGERERTGSGAKPLTLLEFNHRAIQALDLLDLARRENCLLEIGSLDHWGLILDGIDLAHRIDRRQLFGLTTPLLSTGMRLGRTTGGAVWLDPDRLDPAAFWRSWHNTADCDVLRYLRLFTELPLDEVGRLAALEGSALAEARRALADEVTRLVHGFDAARDAAEPLRRLMQAPAAFAPASNSAMRPRTNAAIAN